MFKRVFSNFEKSIVVDRLGRWCFYASPIVLAIAMMMPWLNAESAEDTLPNLPKMGLVSHFEADFVQYEGDSVLGWNDQSSNGNDLVAIGSPKLVINALGDQPAIKFDGVNDRLERITGLIGLPSGNSARTVYMLTKYQGVGFGGMSYGGPSENNAFGLIVDNVGHYGVQGWGIDNDFVTDIEVSDLGWVVQSAVAFPGSMAHFLDGVQISTANHQFNTSTGKFVVGANLDDSSSVDMLVGAILIYDRVLNATERQQVENYLHTKYSTELANNKPPMARDDRKRVPSGSSSSISVLANDSDDGSLSTGSIVIVSQPSFGTVEVNSADGDIVYLHAGNSTADSFTYTVLDDMGELSNIAEVFITIGEPFKLPTTGLVAHYEADRHVTIDTTHVDSWGDQSGNANTLTGIGKVAVVNNAINGQAAMDFDGRNAAFFRDGVLKGFADQDQQRSVFMVVKYDGLGPGGFSYGTPELNKAFGLHVDSDGLLQINGYGLKNDFTSDTKGSGAGWIVHSVTLTNDGDLTHLVNNKIIDTTRHTFDTELSTFVLGADLDQKPYIDMQVAALLIYQNALSKDEQIKVFEYLDGKYGVLSFGVPEAIFDTALVGIGQTIDINVLDNDIDDGILIPSTIEIVQQPTEGTVVVDTTTGLVSYKHNGISTSDLFSYIVADDQGSISNESTVSILVDDDLAPVVGNDLVSIASSASVIVDVLNNDTDDFSIDATTVKIVAEPINGTASIDPFTGFITYSHDGLSVSDEFAYTVSDKAGQISNAGIVSIDIDRPGDLVSDGLVLHLESSKGVITNDNQVESWNDLSGSINNLIAKGSPSLQLDVLNGHPVVDFDGVQDQFIRVDSLKGMPIGSSDRTVYFLSNYRSVGYGGFAYGEPSSNKVFGTIVDSIGHLSIQGWGKNNDFKTSSVATDEGWLLHSVILENNEMQQYRNGESISSSNHLFETTADRIVLGAEIDGSPSLNMQVAAVLVYDRALSEMEDLRVRNYLTIKYDLATSNDQVPVATNDVLVLPNGTVDSIDVLANDFDNGPLDVASVTILQQPSNGVASVNATSGVINYVHNGEGYGDLFTYVVSDELGQKSNVALVTITNLPTGLVAHYEADSGVSIDDDRVVSWSDISGSGNDFTASGDIQLVADSLNGNPILDFDGVDDVFVSASKLSGLPSGGEDRSVFLLINYQSVGSGGFSYGQAAANKTFGLQVNNNGELFINGYATANDFVSGVVGSNVGWMVHSAVLSQGTLVHSANGEPIDHFEHNYNTVANQMVLGADLDVKTTVDMQVAALMVFDKALSAEEEVEVQTYIEGKYNIQGIGSPQTADDQIETLTAGTVDIDVLINDLAVEGTIDASSVEVVRPPSAGQVTVNTANGVISYKHDGSDQIADSFSYTVANNQERTSTEGTVLIAIVDDLSPLAKNDQYDIPNAESRYLAVLDNDLDDFSLDTSSLAILNYPSGGTVVVEQDTGLIRYTHGGKTIGDQFTYTVADNAGQISKIATVSISVTTPNFLPAAGLVLHLESDSGVNTTGEAVNSWEDQSRSNNDLIGIGDPILVQDALNGLPVIDFDGVNDLLERKATLFNFPTSASDRSVILLSKYRGYGYGGFAYGAASSNNAFGAVVDVGGRLNTQGWGAGNDFNSGVVGSGEGWLIQSVVLEKGAVSQYKDGKKIDSDSHVFDTIANRIVVGGSLDGSKFVDMQLAAVLVYDRALTAIEHLQVRKYLSKKYDPATSNDTPPVGVSDSLVLPSGESAVISVLANDSDDNQLLVDTVTIVRRPLHGTAVVNASTGAITYTHAGAVSGDVFTYTVEDNLGQLSSEVEVTVSNLPVGLVAHYEADKGIDLTDGVVTAWADLSNSGNDLTSFGDMVLVENGLNGQVVVDFDGIDDLMKREIGVSSMPVGSSDRSIYFVVNYEGIGRGGFGYGQQTFNKGFGLNVDEHGLLAINGYGSSNDFVSGIPGTGSGWITQSVILNNNTLVHSVNGQTIDQYLHSYETGVGALVLGGGLGEDLSISMQVASLLVFDRALSMTEEVEVRAYLQAKYNIAGIGSPSVQDDIAVTVPGGSIDINVLVNDKPVEGSIDASSVAIVRLPSHGIVSVDPTDGAVSYRHDGSLSFTDSFTYSVANDSGRISSVATVSITIDDDLSPVAMDDTVSVLGSGVVNIDVLANDEDDKSLVSGSIKIVKPPAGGAVVVNSITGHVQYSHDGISTGDEFSYTVVDDAQQISNEALVRIGITTPSGLVTSDLVLHLESDAGVSVADSVLDGWNDQTEFGNDLLAVGGAKLVPNALNGLPVIDLTDDQLERIGGINSLPIGDTDRTLVMLAKYDSVGYGGFSYGDTADNETFGAVVNLNGRLTVQGWGVNNDFISGSKGSSDGWFVQSIVVDSTKLTHYKNNEEIDSDMHSFNTSANRMVLGAGLGGTPNVEMHVAAILLYSRALSAIERLQVQNYLAIKYDFETSNDSPPIAYDDTLIIPEGNAAFVEVLKNDLDDGVIDQASVTIVDPPKNGSAAVNASTGAISYLHNGASLRDNFTYTVTDNLGQVSNVATVNIAKLPSGLVAHFESDTGVVERNGVVSSWIDQSAQRNTLVASGDIRLIPNVINGQAALDLDGIGDVLMRTDDVSGLPLGAANRSAYFVAKYEGIGRGGIGYGQQTSNKAFGLRIDDDGLLGISAYGNANSYVSTTSGTGANWLVQSVVLTDNTLVHSVNGNILDKFLHRYDTAHGPLIVGADFDQNSNVDMQIAAIMIFDRALNEFEQSEVQAYLNDKYNVVSVGAPLAVSDEGIVQMAGTVVVDVLVNDFPVDGAIDPSSVVIRQRPTEGSVLVNSISGLVTYEHAGGSEMFDSFTYTVANGTGRISSEAKVVIVVDDDLAPIAANDIEEVFVASSVVFDVLENDLDDNGIDETTVRISEQPINGSVVVDPITGQITYTHNGLSAHDSFSYSVSDFSNQISNTAIVDVSITTSDSLVESNLVLHLEADTGVSLNGVNVVTWADQSPSKNDLLSVGSPTLLSDSLNGFPVISFDGKGDRLQRLSNVVGLPTANDDRSVFVLGKYKGDGFGGFAYGSANTNRAFGAIVDSLGRLAAQGWGNGNDFLSKVPAKNQGWLVQSVVVDSDTVSQYLNGELINTDVHTFDTALDRIVLGAGLSGASFTDMEVAAVLVYDKALSVTQRLQVNNYFDSKYDLESSNELVPIARNDRIVLQSGDSVVAAILSNDSDDFGIDVSTVTITQYPNNGSVAVNTATGSVTYTHDGSRNGDVFAYTVRDTVGQLSNEAIVTVSNLPSGIAAHFESDDGVLVEGDLVLGWNDLSSQSIDMTAQGDVLLGQNIVNGHPALVFDGVDDLLIQNNVARLPLGTSNRSVYFVANYQGVGSGGFGYGQSANNKAFGLHAQKSGLLSIAGYGGGNDYVSDSLATDAGWIVQSAILEDNTLLHAVNGETIDKFVHTYGTGIGPMVIGAEIDLNTAVQMQVAALIIFNRALNTEERQLVQLYLQAKYQVQGVAIQ